MENMRSIKDFKNFHNLNLAIGQKLLKTLYPRTLRCLEPAPKVVAFGMSTTKPTLCRSVVLNFRTGGAGCVGETPPRQALDEKESAVDELRVTIGN